MNEDFCHICNSPLKKTLTPNISHYGRLDCPKCGFVGWARNPISNKIGTTAEKRSGSKMSVIEVCNFHGYKEEFCFFCLRKRNQLGCKETLTIDHILELQKKDGLDKINNMQVLCTACHKLKNWIRLYFNWHIQLKEGEEDGNTNS